MFDRISKWEPWLTDYIPVPATGDGQMALDIGAAHGTYALDLAVVWEEVWAFEPDPRTYIALERMTRYDANIKCFEVALSHTFGSRQLDLKADPEKSSFKTELDAETSEDSGKVLVQMNTLDLITFPKRVKFVKVDTEGSEGDILAGASHFQSHHNPDWLIEYHSEELLKEVADWLEVHARKKSLFHIPHPNTEVKGHGWVSTYGP